MLRPPSVRSAETRGAPSLRSGPRGRRAFTFLELLAALLIVAILSGAVAVVWRPFNTNPREEARRVELWLMRALAKSGRTRRAFSLECAAGVLSPALILAWQRPPEQDVLEAQGGCRFVNQGAAARSFYSPQWNTFTPAVTIGLLCPGAEKYFVVISGYGRIRTSPNP